MKKRWGRLYSMRPGMQVGVGEDSGSVGPAGLERVPGRPTGGDSWDGRGHRDVMPLVTAVALLHAVGRRCTHVGAVREPPTTDGRRPATTRVRSRTTVHTSAAPYNYSASQRAKGSMPVRCCPAIASAADCRSALRTSSVTPNCLSWDRMSGLASAGIKIRR